MNTDTTYNKIKDKTEIYFFALFIMVTLVMLIRAFFGVEVTDEAYYMAEARTVLEGNLPYALDNSSTVGMTFVMLPFIWIFRFFSPDYEGLFIYMRICFVLFKSFLTILSYYTLKKKLGVLPAACGSIVMTAFHMLSIQNFSYNTVSTLLIYYVGISLYCAVDNCASISRMELLYFILGVLSALAVFAHPVHSVSVIVFLIALIIFRVKLRYYIRYIAGGLAQVIIVILPVIMRSGLGNFIQGVTLLTDDVGKFGKPNAISVLGTLYVRYISLWMIMAAAFIGIILVREKEYYNRNDGLLKSFYNCIYRDDSAVFEALFVSVIIGAIYDFFRGNAQEMIQYIGACGLFVVVALLFTRTRSKCLWLVGIPAVSICLIEAFTTTSSSPDGRMIHVVPALVALFMIYGERENRQYAWLLPAVTSLSIVFCELYGLRYVYRDSMLHDLTYSVERGIYKGIYTTEQNARDIIECEDYIKSVTDNNELIAFRDNVPAGYLFMNGRICDIRTWDCMQYSYGINNPTHLFAYYERRKAIPDKIIYVDYGRDDHLSMDDKGFRYNDFLNNNYDIMSDKELNGTYKRIVVFARQNGRLESL